MSPTRAADPGHYFANRRDFLLAALERAAQLSGQRQRAIAETMQGRQALEAILEEELPIDSRRLGLTRIFVFFYAEAVTHIEARRMIDLHLSRWRKATQAVVKEAQSLGELDPRLCAADVAADLVAYVDGLSVQALFNDDVMRRVRRFSPVRGWIDLLAPADVERP
jgi:AcrR family transcriptional regulator